MEWYRRESWSEGAAREFDARLKRCREHNRNQYLRIQAATLAQAGDLPNAVALYERFLDEYPDAWDAVVVLTSLGEIYARRGQPDRALSLFRKSLERQRIRPGVRVPTHTAFARVAIHHQCADLYAEALAHMDEFRYDRGLFPSSDYTEASLSAFLCEQLGDLERAKSEARVALVAMTRTRSAAAKHPRFGVPVSADLAEHEHLVALAGPEWTPPSTAPYLAVPLRAM